MTRKDRVVLYGRLGLVLMAFAMIGGVVAEPLFRPLWSPKADGCPTIAHPEANFSYTVHIENRPVLIVRSNLAGTQANDRHQAVHVPRCPPSWRCNAS